MPSFLASLRMLLFGVGVGASFLGTVFAVSWLALPL
jgi:hypothetical protein